ncbi:ATP-binding protein [Propionivibrio dicarboxylicus]|uniref:histidine kinase n=1 Tax=Propionivibrio dicarboxylicus TaxID=83767 RepID=A0A1G8HIY2_9RHOO|nr:ATP-binding protein [Propionivibrio dicarboxylicus]SDI06657.1 two-component system, OmpR family, sensor histidine kinase RstB [Propionivibrio dicarboxylicus]
MTGNNGGRNRRLLDILWRYKPTPWRGSYSLSRLFLSFYLLVMGSFVAIAFFADFVISTSVRDITDDYTRRFMQGTIVLIEEDLFRKPRKDWPDAIRALDRKFSYKLDIVERWTLKLKRKQAEKLDAGELAIDTDGDVLYHRLKNTSQVLVVGPLSPNANPERPRSLPLELRVRLLTWSLIGFILAIAVWFWVRPVWRDLEALRKTARALGEGHFESRAPEARSRAFELLTETLNGMAERMQRLIAMQKELSSAISHELRTPIARMRFAVEMLPDADQADERERLQTMMNDDLEELDNLIDASLTYSRFEREQPELHLTSVDLAEWLNDNVDGIRILGRSLEITVDCSNLPPGQQVELDLKSMPYALTNLLRNAIKYAHSRVVVSAQISGSRALVHVDDDGIGIAPEERQKVFSAFTRLDRSRDRATGGYGLGLAIVRLVLEQHGGSAIADASPLGGARFTLNWPVLHSVTQS